MSRMRGHPSNSLTVNCGITRIWLTNPGRQLRDCPSVSLDRQLQVSIVILISCKNFGLCRLWKIHQHCVGIEKQISQHIIYYIFLLNFLAYLLWLREMERANLNLAVNAKLICSMQMYELKNDMFIRTIFRFCCSQCCYPVLWQFCFSS